MEFGATHLGGPVTGADATGRFAVARVEVTNTGDEPVTFDYAHQQLIDSRGAAHTPDLPGSMSLNGEFRHDYNPGVGTTLQLAFDLPADTTPAKRGTEHDRHPVTPESTQNSSSDHGIRIGNGTSRSMPGVASAGHLPTNR
ncbi:Mpr protein [Mycobacteroides abscessus subsp. abscessus]|nr:Mpr protein [Mycobacteroides abscessus subsp. abscessus]